MASFSALVLACGDYLASLTRWPRIIAALLLGALATLSMAPFYIMPALLAAYVGLTWLESGTKNARQGFWLGVAFGLGFHASGLHWIYFAYLVPPADFAALGAPSVLGLAAGMGLFYGVALALLRIGLRFLPSQFAVGATRLMLMAVALALLEWLRGHLLTGFPWNQPSQALLGWLPLAQAASLFGSYGLNLVVLLACLLLAACGMRAIGGAERRIAVGGGLALIVALAAFGVARLALVDDSVNHKGIYLRIVQPNIGQSEKWLPENRAASFAKLLKLSTIASEQPITLVIWPETALPFPINRFPEVLEAIGRIAPRGSYVLTGAPRQFLDGDRWRTFNSLFAIDDQGSIAATYDKAHLVPFGEYVPLNGLLGLGDTIGRGSFDSGPGPRTIALPGMAPFSPLICYEAIFSGDMVESGKRPLWLLNITNDAWFGRSIGPHQHLSSARLRSIEEGLPLVRAANTGISAIIDALGNQRVSLALDKEGIIDDFLPRALPPTLFAVFGDWILVLLLLVVSMAAIGLRKALPISPGFATQTENMG